MDEDVEEYLEDAPVAQEDYDANKVLQLGDRVLINSDRYGIVWGTIYYRDNEMLRLRPDSASNMLLDFPRIYEDGKDAFTPDLGVKECFILKKRNPVYPDFVRQQARLWSALMRQGWPVPITRSRVSMKRRIASRWSMWMMRTTNRC